MTDGVAPPHDVEAEGAVLSAVMITGDGRVLDELQNLLRPEVFYAEAHRRIFEACADLHARGQPSDVVMVGSWLRDRNRLTQVGGMAYLTEILNVAPHMPSVPAYARIVRDKWRIRQVIARCQAIAAAGYTHIEDPQVFIDDAEAALHELARVTNAAKLSRYGDVARRVHASLLEAAKAGVELRGESWGFPELDKHTLGLRDGRVYVLAARPSVGKSALAINVAQYVARPRPTNEVQKHVVMFSLEMGNDELGERAISGSASVDQTRMGRPKLLRSDEWHRMMDTMRNAHHVNLHFCDDAGITVPTIKSLLRALVSDLARTNAKLGLVIVDYLQLMEHPGRRRTDNREQEVSAVSRGLKIMAKEFQVPLLALSQLNRSGEAKGAVSAARPKLSDLRESGAIEQDADGVLFLHPVAPPKAAAGPKMPERGERKPTPHELIVAKMRNGQKGTILLDFQGHLTRFAQASGPAGNADEPEYFDGAA